MPEVEQTSSPRRCVICGDVDPDDLVPLAVAHLGLTERIAAKMSVPLEDDDHICRSCLNRERIAHSTERLREERGELTALESEIAKQATMHLAIARDADEVFERGKTFGNRTADRVAAIGGSWAFVIGFFTALAVWIVANVILATRSFDPYPFILLNLVLSTLAAVQAPIIMMSQNRVAARDRAQASEDFRTNLKAELEIASLHEKIDHLLHSQWEQLIEMQTTQLDLLQQLASKKTH
ncbi:MAG TPA: DUF1003 domain-containing protein [Kofleriaceae bacterium]|jgi:uncharacterized membrane protein